VRARRPQLVERAQLEHALSDAGDERSHIVRATSRRCYPYCYPKSKIAREGGPLSG
jgi:hypothetical protein